MFRNSTTAPAILAIAVLLAWFNALTASFQFDDFNVIVNNPAVHSLEAWWNSMPGIRPLLKLSYALNWTVSSGAFGFHLFNVLVHAANAVLVFLLLRALRPGMADSPLPFVIAMLFALHPVQTEAVTYVCGRSVSLMALFYLGSLIAHVHAGSAAFPWRWRIASACLFATALMVKETAVTLPLALLLIENVRGKPSFTSALKRQALHLLVLAAAMAVAMLLSPTYRHLLEVSLAIRPFLANLLTQANAITYLVQQLLMPWNLNADPDLPVVMEASNAFVLQGLLIAAVILYGLSRLGRRPWGGFGLTWFFIHLLPTNSLLPRFDVANDRQLYLACIGIFIVLVIDGAWLLEKIGRPRIARAATALLIIGLGIATAMRNQVYATPVDFWEDAAVKSPAKPRVHNNLGWAYQQAGRRAEARLSYLQALELDPDYWRARINLDVLDNADVKTAPGSQ